MKLLKKTWLSFFNRLLSLLLALLGFASCDGGSGGGGLLMYGMPPAKYTVKANVLDGNNSPITGIRVNVKAEGHNNSTMLDGLTDANGMFTGKVPAERVNVVCEDVDGDKNGVFEKDSVQADISTMADSRFEFTIKLKPKK